MRFTVAIDGPAAAGKGTISKAIAKHFGFAHLDTGLLYRAVGRKVMDGTDAVAAARSLSPEDLAVSGLRSVEAGAAASKVAAIPEVRAALVEFQRDFATRDGGAVLDGRDIGTVICPNADAKLFVTASADVRAKRRFAEIQGRGESGTFEAVLSSVIERDERDASRETSPMVAAEDAFVLDTSDMAIDEAVAEAIAFIEDARKA